MRITLKQISTEGYPQLFQIEVEGKKYEGGRVLKMGNKYLPIWDKGGLANIGSFWTAREAAKHVVESTIKSELELE